MMGVLLFVVVGLCGTALLAWACCCPSLHGGLRCMLGLHAWRPAYCWRGQRQICARCGRTR